MTGGVYRLYEHPGWGSAIVEAQLALYDLPHVLVPAGEVAESAAARAALGEVNPLVQVPVLLLPDGSVMTESAAMTLHLAEVAGSEALVPAPGRAERPAFLRWLVFLVANLYAVVSLDDHAAELLPEPAMAETLRRALDLRRKELWRQYAAGTTAHGGAWSLGDRFSALDLYVGVMAQWKPGRAWFAAELPDLARIAEAVAERPDLSAVIARNFPETVL